MDREVTEVIDEMWKDSSTNAVLSEHNTNLDTQLSGSNADTHVERVEYWQDMIPQQYFEQYDHLLRKNCAPRTAAAVCWYVAGLEERSQARTQKEIANQFDISQTTIRKWYTEIISDNC